MPHPTTSEERASYLAKMHEALNLAHEYTEFILSEIERSNHSDVFEIDLRSWEDKLAALGISSEFTAAFFRESLNFLLLKRGIDDCFVFNSAHALYHLLVGSAPTKH